MATAPKKAPAPAAAPKPAAKLAVVPETRAPGDLVVSAKLSDNDKVISIEYNFGASLAEMSELFGEEVVYNKAMDAMIIDAQAKLRRHLRASFEGKNAKGEVIKAIPLPKDLQELFADWKPSAGRTERKSAAEKVQTLVGKLTDEERKALIARLKAEG